jgi:hypothetical protein
MQPSVEEVSAPGWYETNLVGAPVTSGLLCKSQHETGRFYNNYPGGQTVPRACRSG